MNEKFKERFNEAIDAEIPDLLDILQSHYGQIPSHRKGIFNQLKAEFSDRPNIFTLGSWKARFLVLIGQFKFEVPMSSTTSNQHHPSDDPNPVSKQKILFLAASPTNEARLQTDAEYRIIQQRLQAAEERDSFELLNPALSVRITDLIKVMNQKPEIVHFSGHGSMDGIIISNDQNEAQLMPTAAIKRLFKQHKDSTRLVVLNACYSAEQAKVISEFEIYVIGMHVEIADDAAINFAGGLYIGLGAGKSIEQAFEDAMIVISTTHPNMELVPEIWKDGEKLDL
jgi:hypothetical protein